MGKIREYRQTTDTTADCVRILNSFKKGDWKRKYKFNLKVSSHGDAHSVRVFTNGTDIATIVSSDRETFLMEDMDLHEHKEIIDKINNISKFYYTHDYGNVWYDPYESKLWVSGGDGGLCYSEESPEVVLQQMENGEGADAPYFHQKVAELNDSTFEAESDPTEEDGNYILIGYINDIGDVEEGERGESIEELKVLLKRYEREERYEKCADIKAKITKLEKKS